VIYSPKRGNPQLQRTFAGLPTIRRAVPADAYAAVNAALDALYDDEQLDALRAFQAGDISVAEILAAKRKGRLDDLYLLERVKLDRPLWESLASAVQQLGHAPGTRERYHWSIEKLKTVTRLGASAKVRGLLRVNWRELDRAWTSSDADWMRMRQMVGAALTVLLGDTYHPWRRQVMKAIPRRKEKPRVVELSVREFWALVKALPDQAKPGVVTLAATGFRLGEYLSCEKRHLHPATLSVTNPRGKTGADVVYVAERLWPWIAAAIPAPIQARWLRIHFHRARTKIKRPDLTLHDLRHVYGQLAADAGVAQSKIQAAMRHETPAMTARYLTRVAKREVADAVGRGLTKRRKRA